VDTNTTPDTSNAPTTLPDTIAEVVRHAVVLVRATGADTPETQILASALGDEAKRRGKRSWLDLAAETAGKPIGSAAFTREAAREIASNKAFLRGMARGFVGFALPKHDDLDLVLVVGPPQQTIRLAAACMFHEIGDTLADKLAGIAVYDVGNLEGDPVGYYVIRDGAQASGTRTWIATSGPDAGIDAKWIDDKFAWSLKTFGPGERLQGVTKHIEKELEEVRKDPKDPDEWADLIILAMDGASRQGIDGARLINAIRAKQLRNERRTWPDWRTRSEDEPIEHDRTVAEPR